LQRIYRQKVKELRRKMAQSLRVCGVVWTCSRARLRCR